MDDQRWEAYSEALKILRPYIYDFDELDDTYYWFKDLPSIKLVAIAKILETYGIVENEDFQEAVEIAKEYPHATFSGALVDHEQIKIQSVVFRIGDEIFVIYNDNFDLWDEL